MSEVRGSNPAQDTLYVFFLFFFFSLPFFFYTFILMFYVSRVCPLHFTSELLSFISACFTTKLAMQLATQNFGSIYSKNSTLKHSCQLTHRERNSGVKLPLIWKENAFQSFLNNVLSNQKPTANELDVKKRAILRLVQGEIKYSIFMTVQACRVFNFLST